MSETVDCSCAGKANVKVWASELPAPENTEIRSSPPSPATMSQPGARTPDNDTDEETQAVPPIWGQHRIIQEVEPDVKTINIHIQINIPSTFKLPSFGRFDRSKCRQRRREAISEMKPQSIWLARILTIFYLSFIACGGAAWGVRNNSWLRGVNRAPLVIGTFTPFFDAFATVSTIYLVRRYNDSDRPKRRFFAVLCLHFILTVLHFVVLGFAAAWLDSYEWGYERSTRETISGLVLYSMSTMLLMKIILAIYVLRKTNLRQSLRENIAQLPSTNTKEAEYQRLTGNCDPDAAQIESARSSSEGRIYLA